MEENDDDDSNLSRRSGNEAAIMENEQIINEMNIMENEQMIEENITEMNMRVLEELQRKRRIEEEGEEEDSSLERWNLVSKRGKTAKRNEDYDILGQERTVDICVTDKNSLPKQFALAQLLRNNNITGIQRIKYINAYKIIVSFEEEQKAQTFLNCKTFLNLGWRRQKTSEVGISYGIIKNIELELSPQAILDNITCETEIISVIRLNRRKTEEENNDPKNQEKWIPSETVRIGFLGPSLPAYVKVENLRIPVEPFVFGVTQCARCWRFGHILKTCTAKRIICPKCGDYHSTCEAVTFKCVNCSGNHLALDKSCPMYLKQKRIRELMSEFNCTYRKALLLYVPQSPIRENIPHSSHENTTRNHNAPLPSKSNLQQPLSAQIPEFINHMPNSELQEPSTLQERNTLQKKKKNKSKKRKNSVSSSEDSNSPVYYAVEREEEELSMPTRNTNRKRNSDGTFIELLNKLKNIILERGSLSDKIKLILENCIDWVVAVVVRYMSDWSLFTKIFSNG